MSFAALQDHALSRVLALPPRAKDLQRDLRNALLQARDNDKLATSPQEVFQLVTLLPELPDNVAGQLRAGGLHANAYCIAGGEKNQERDRVRRHFKRNDGAWFDFTITVREHGGQLELLAYDFEIRFPSGAGTPFLRFDLNLPGHRNQDRDLRSHLHPGSDDVQVPTPLMTPIEVLALLIDGLRLPADRDKPRGLTAFEIGWFRDTHASLTRAEP